MLQTGKLLKDTVNGREKMTGIKAARTRILIQWRSVEMEGYALY